MKKRRIKKKAFAKLFIFIGLIVLLVAGFLTTLFILKKVNGEARLLNIELNGEKEIILKIGETYEDEGATSTYDNIDITSDIQTNSNIDFEHIGDYKYTYKITYKKQTKEIERTIKIIDDIEPSITLKGRKKAVIVEGYDFDDPGATAEDNYEGDISDKIEVDTSNLDKNTIGDYKITYTVTDSSGNKASVERDVRVAKKAERIPVLNYHFFFEDYDKKACEEDICLHMDNFREQLQYLVDNGFYTVTMNEFVRWMYEEIELPEKSILITVDDGAHGTSKINGNHLGPALLQYDVYATLFLITAWWDVEDYQNDHLDIQSHTYDLHRGGNCGMRSKVNCVSYDVLLDDLKKSLKFADNADSFCFPYYEYTDTSIKAVKEAGFKVAFIGGGRKATRKDDKYKIPRYAVQRTTTMDTFKRWVN